MKTSQLFKATETYVSPAIKVKQIGMRRFVCMSPVYGENNKAGSLIGIDYGEDGEDIGL